MMTSTARLDLVFIVLAVLLVLWGVRRTTRPPLIAQGSGFLGAALSLTPGVRRLVIAPQLALICDLLAKLLRAGAPLPYSIGLVATAGVNPLFRAALQRLERAVAQGNSLSESITSLPAPLRMPVRLTSAVAMGERAGRLPEALEHTAEMYRDDSSGHAQILSDSLLPAGIAVLGFLNAAIVIYSFGLLISITELANRWM